MLIVKIFINERQIDEIEVKNVSNRTGGMQMYEIRKPEVLDFRIHHKYSEGHIPLLAKVFDFLKRHEYHPMGDIK